MDTEGTVHATFTIAPDGAVTSKSSLTTEMITSMIASHRWTPAQAVEAFIAGWSNGYVLIKRSPDADHA